MVEASKPVNLGQLSAELGAVAAHVAEPTLSRRSPTGWADGS